MNPENYEIEYWNTDDGYYVLCSRCPRSVFAHVRFDENQLSNYIAIAEWHEAVAHATGPPNPKAERARRHPPVN